MNNNWDLIPVLLLMLLGVALVSGSAIILLALHWKRRQTPLSAHRLLDFPDVLNFSNALCSRPASWLAVRSHNLPAVQAALGLSNPRPCTWTQGFATEQKLFIAPPVKGWILVTGSGLPDPGDDVDACFRFLLNLSRQLGQVQFFSANPVLGHHAWVRADARGIMRAYAWAGKTLWNQGVKTHAELELGLKCLEYFETPEPLAFGQPDGISANTDRVPLLAARWSLDPATIDEHTVENTCGIAGEPSRHY
jgi:hypothetical protein